MNEKESKITNDILQGKNDDQSLIRNGYNGPPPSPVFELKPTSPPPPPKDK